MSYEALNNPPTEPVDETDTTLASIDLCKRLIFPWPIVIFGFAVSMSDQVVSCLGIVTPIDRQ